MSESTPHDQMARMIAGYWQTQMIYAAAKLGLADRLASCPRTVDELAADTETHPRSLYRLLRALASIGIFAEDASGRYSQTPLSECLRREVPGSQWAMAVVMGEEHYQAWGDLVGTVRTGEIAFERLYGQPVFAFLSERPDKAAVFDAYMTAMHGRETHATLDTYDFTGIGVLADLGGGNGTNLAGILGRHPAMRGILFDLPHVVERAAVSLKRTGLSGRCEIVGGDFFVTIPCGADAYFLRHILHDWDDERAMVLLRNVRRAMSPRSRLLVVESVVPTGNGPSFGKLMDLTMMVLPGGVERTAQEYRRLFEAAGFRLTKIVPTSAGVDVVEAVCRDDK
jgi:O-methyltransferase domain/Dimerisation domain